MSNYIDLEIIHTLPFANANRDDSGLPKTVQMGGAARGRLSSQSVKRAARFYGADTTGGFSGEGSANAYFRTKRVRDLLETELEKREENTPENVERLNSLFGEKSAFGKISEGKGADKSLRQDVLTVVTLEEIQALADYATSEEFDSKTAATKVRSILNSSGKRDLALWGRFFASDDTATLDGSAQVAHAFTTHSVTTEQDFFVGMDDAANLFSDHAGAGHPDNAFYLTGTFYKYANLNIEETLLNLANGRMTRHGIEVPQEITEEVIEKIKEDFTFIVREFVENLALSVPQGKVRSTAHGTLPSLVRVAQRDGRPVNGATAFEAPISAPGKGIIANSIDSLGSTHKRLEAFVGEPAHSGYVYTYHEPLNDDSVTFGVRHHNLKDLVGSAVESANPKVEAFLSKLRESAVVAK